MSEHAVFYSVLVHMSPYSDSCTFPVPTYLYICAYCGTVLLSRRGERLCKGRKGRGRLGNNGAVGYEISCGLVLCCCGCLDEVLRRLSFP